MEHNQALPVTNRWNPAAEPICLLVGILPAVMAGRRKKALKPMKQRTRRAALSYDQWLRARLAADPDLSVEYLRQVLEQSETPEELLLGLRRVAEVLGMSRVAEVAGLSRESLYRSLSAAGNPRLSTLVAVLRVAGLRLSVRPAAA